MTVSLKCKICNGTGRAPLSEILLDTLRAVSRDPGESATFYQRKRFRGVSPAALNNRLEHLRSLGLVKRERQGHEWLYFTATVKRR